MPIRGQHPIDEGYTHTKGLLAVLFFALFLPQYDISHLSQAPFASWQFPSGKFFLTSFPIINILYDVSHDPELVVLRPNEYPSSVSYMTIKIQKKKNVA